MLWTNPLTKRWTSTPLIQGVSVVKVVLTLSIEKPTTDPWENSIAKAAIEFSQSPGPLVSAFLVQKCPQYCWEFQRGPLRNHFWKSRVPSRTGGGDNSGNALEPSNALNYRVWGIPAVLSRGIPGKTLRAFPGSFQNFFGISSGKSQPYWGYGPKLFRENHTCTELRATISRRLLPPIPGGENSAFMQEILWK